jgi:hypothetical protein
MESEIAESGEPIFGDKDICERRVADAALQFEHGHFAHRILLAP